LEQGVQRNGVLRVLLGQLQELPGEVVPKLVHAADELQALLVGQDAPARRNLVFLEKRLVLFRWRGRLALAFALARRRQAKHENQGSPNCVVHESSPGTVERTMVSTNSICREFSARVGSCGAWQRLLSEGVAYPVECPTVDANCPSISASRMR